MTDSNTCRTFANLGKSQVGISVADLDEAASTFAEDFNEHLREALDDAAKRSSMVRQWAYMVLCLFDGMVLEEMEKASDWDATKLVVELNKNFTTRRDAQD